MDAGGRASARRTPEEPSVRHDWLRSMPSRSECKPTALVSPRSASPAQVDAARQQTPEASARRGRPLRISVSSAVATRRRRAASPIADRRDALPRRPTRSRRACREAGRATLFLPRSARRIQAATASGAAQSFTSRQQRSDKVDGTAPARPWRTLAPPPAVPSERQRARAPPLHHVRRRSRTPEAGTSSMLSRRSSAKIIRDANDEWTFRRCFRWSRPFVKEATPAAASGDEAQVKFAARAPAATASGAWCREGERGRAGGGGGGRRPKEEAKVSRRRCSLRATACQTLKLLAQRGGTRRLAEGEGAARRRQ